MSTSCNRFETVTSRRELLHKSASGFGLLALQGLLHADAVAAPPKNINPLAPKAPHFKAKAKRVIFVFMHGGPSQVDTFDPKPELTKYNGQPIPNLDQDPHFKVRNPGKLLASSRKFAPCGRAVARPSSSDVAAAKFVFTPSLFTTQRQSC